MNSFFHFFSIKNLIILFSMFGLLSCGILVIYALKISPSLQVQSQPLASPIPSISTVTALGRIEPQGEVIKVAPSPDLGGAKIAQLMVKEGDKVQQGQVIAILDTLERKQADVKLAQESVKVAQANLEIVKAKPKKGDIELQRTAIRQAQRELMAEKHLHGASLAKLNAQLIGEKNTQAARIAKLKAEFYNAEREYYRYKTLAEQGAISTSDLERHRLSLDQARESLKEAEMSNQKTIAILSQEIKELQAETEKKQYLLEAQIEEANAKLESLTEIRQVELQKSQSELQRAIVELEKAKIELNTAYVKAPSLGQVLNIYTKVGEKVTGSDGIIALGNTQQMIVVAEVYESDIKKFVLDKKPLLKVRIKPLIKF
ncbi:MAG: biotin/lipoyl-binding protein [Snowella sp.]